MILYCIDCFILKLSKWKKFRIVDRLIGIYVQERVKDFCMMCCGFWVGLFMYFVSPVMEGFFLNGFFFSALGWLATRLEELSIKFD